MEKNLFLSLVIANKNLPLLQKDFKMKYTKCARCGKRFALSVEQEIFCSDICKEPTEYDYLFGETFFFYCIVDTQDFSIEEPCEKELYDKIMFNVVAIYNLNRHQKIRTAFNYSGLEYTAYWDKKTSSLDVKSITNKGLYTSLIDCISLKGLVEHSDKDAFNRIGEYGAFLQMKISLKRVTSKYYCERCKKIFVSKRKKKFCEECKIINSSKAKEISKRSKEEVLMDKIEQEKILNCDIDCLLDNLGDIE